MPTVEFPYADENSKIFGNVKRPRTSIGVFSELDNDRIIVDDVPADTGADLTVLPRFIGELLVEGITNLRVCRNKGSVPASVLIAFIHKDIPVRIDKKEFKQAIAIAD